MIIAAAQTVARDGNITENLENHIRMAKRAAREGATFIIFPEMSLTGYQKEEASALALSINDDKIGPLREAANTNHITIAAGAPVRDGGSVHIGMLIIQPGHTHTLLYTKQYLHAGEEVFFVPSFDHNPLPELENVKTAFAICADISHKEHAEASYKRGAGMYAAGIFYTPAGIAEGYANLQSYADTYCMPVLMANYCGTSYHLPAAGMSAFWDEKGQLTGALEPDKEGLLVITRGQTGWAAKKIYDI